MSMVNIPFGRYQLTERLAAGTVADLYRATTMTAGGQSMVVVIKRIREDLSHDPNFAGAFIDEARIAAALDHPNIAKVYEWSRQDEVLFIALEYIEGTNLASLMQSCSEQGLRFPATLAIHVVAELLAGLGYAHTRTDAYGHLLQIVHRGVSPQNVLLSSEGQVKLVDFGMARASSRVHGTRPGIFGGQITYLAPEVAARRPVDARTDVYSCGVMLYELLTGQKLHAAATNDARIVAQTMQARPPSGVHADIPADLDTVVLRAAALDPDARFASAGLMRQELQAFLARWDRRLDPEALSAFLVEALSGRSAGKREGGFAFGEATSHWFAQGEELVRTDPDLGELLGDLPDPAPGDRPDAGEPLMVPPKGSFSAGSTVMAVEQSGLGRSRQVKAFGIVAGGLLVAGVLVALVLGSLSGKPEAPRPAVEPLESKNEGFSGPVQVKTVPDGVLVFVDGDPVESLGNPPRILNLRAGKRRFKLIAPGYLPWEGDVELEQGLPRTIEQVLEVHTGTLVVRSRPPRAMAFFDGKRVGQTPVRIPNVSAAKAHKLVLQAKRHVPFKLEIRPGDWPEDPQAEFVLEHELVPIAKKKPPKRRRR